MKDYNQGLHGAANRINRNLQSKLTLLCHFGQSKHYAKQQAREEYLWLHGNLKGYNPAKLKGIYSIRTMETYRQTAREFAIWAANSGCKNASRIDRSVAGRYLQERQAQGKSAWTVSKDMAALNKLFDYGFAKAELGLKKRSLDDITRSRSPTANDKRSFKQDADQMLFSKASGCRRQSVLRVRPSDLLRNAKGEVVAVMLVEKGGKLRVAPILNEYKRALTEAVDKRCDGDKPLFERYDSHIDNHAFRGEYATALLKQLEIERASKWQLCQGDFDPGGLVNLRGRDAESDAPYRGHDRDIVAMVSGALGHNRLCIVFQNYIR